MGNTMKKVLLVVGVSFLLSASVFARETNSMRSSTELVKLGDSEASLLQKMGTANPIRAKQYLENNLVKKFDAMRVKGHVLTKEEERWIAIFQRYASKNDDNISSGNSVGGTKPSTLSDDDLEDVDD
jgi:hypothetical protein